MAGDFFSFGEGLTSAKMNKQTDNLGAGVAQNAYQTLQANNVFDNKDQLAADEFTDSNGTNNTVNTGSSTSVFDTNKYVLGADNTYPGDGSTNTASQTGLGDTFPGQTAPRGMGGVCLQSCFVKSFTINSSVSGATRFRIMDGSNSQIYSQTFSGTGEKTMTSEFFLQSGENYYFVVDNGGSSYTFIRDTSPNFSDSIDFNLNSGYESSPGGDSGNLNNIKTETALYATSSTVVADSNTLTLDGTESAITIYSDVTNTANTTVTVDISDGTTTLSAKALNETHDITSLSAAATLQLTFNLTTTDAADTPEFYGYACHIIR